MLPPLSAFHGGANGEYRPSVTGGRKLSSNIGAQPSHGTYVCSNFASAQSADPGTGARGDARDEGACRADRREGRCACLSTPSSSRNEPVVPPLLFAGLRRPQDEAAADKAHVATVFQLAELLKARSPRQCGRTGWLATWLRVVGLPSQRFYRHSSGLVRPRSLPYPTAEVP